jgi:ADP-ribose pyrophosphatase YjhB (NUDIX family)
VLLKSGLMEAPDVAATARLLADHLGLVMPGCSSYLVLLAPGEGEDEGVAVLVPLMQGRGMRAWRPPSLDGSCSSGDEGAGLGSGPPLHGSGPGLLDNLAAGGLTAGESPLTTALRELAEEASLHLPNPGRLRGSGVIRTQRHVPQGWHDEQLLVFTLHLSERETPINADGEVQEFKRLSPGEVVSCMQSGLFTVDACASLAQSLAWLMAGSHAKSASGKVR